MLTLLFLGLETLLRRLPPPQHGRVQWYQGGSPIGDRGSPTSTSKPYKPVLGYSIQLALLTGTGYWSGFLAVRLGMVYLTGKSLFLGALWLPTGLQTRAVCLAYALMIVMTSLVEWAIEVRLDMLTALAGFVSLLLLLNRQVAWRGLVAGLSFLISQKGTMYAFAGGIALLGSWRPGPTGIWVRDVLGIQHLRRVAH